MSRGFSFAIFLVLVVWSVNALFLQAEMAALNSTPLPNVVVKTVLFLLVLAGGLSQKVSGRGGTVPRPIFMLWLGFVIYLMVETLILVLRFEYSASYVLFSFNAYYFPILLLPFFFYLRRTVNESLITRTFLVFFVPLGLLGIAQNLTGHLFLPTGSPNEYLQVMSWDFYGSIRAFSLFSSPSDFGHFIAIIGGLGMAFCLEKNGSAIKGAVIVLLAVICGYCTLTRATQLEIACAMFTVWALYRCTRYRLLISLCPIIYGIFGMFVAFVLPIWLAGTSEENLLSTSSILQRYEQWARYGALWLGGDVSTFLFGAGLAQNDRFQTGANVVVDNSFLAIGIHTGVIGLMLWLAIIWYVWAYMLAQSQKVLTPVRAAAAGAWSVCLFTSVFNVTLFLPLPFAMFLLSKKQWGTRVAPVQPAGISRQVHQRSVGTLEGRLMDGPA